MLIMRIFFFHAQGAVYQHIVPRHTLINVLYCSKMCDVAGRCEGEMGTEELK